MSKNEIHKITNITQNILLTGGTKFSDSFYVPQNLVFGFYAPLLTVGSAENCLTENLNGSTV